MNIATLIPLAFAVAVPRLVFAEPITLKGLAPGMTKAQVSAAHDSLASGCLTMPRDPLIEEICGYSTEYHKGLPALHTFADVHVREWRLYLKSGTVHTVSLSFSANEFPRVEAALVERWGRPSSRIEGEVKNRMGARFDQVQSIWKRDGSILRAVKRSDNVDESDLVLTTERAAADLERARKQGAKKAAKDM